MVLYEYCRSDVRATTSIQGEHYAASDRDFQQRNNKVKIESVMRKF